MLDLTRGLLSRVRSAPAEELRSSFEIERGDFSSDGSDLEMDDVNIDHSHHDAEGKVKLPLADADAEEPRATSLPPFHEGSQEPLGKDAHGQHIIENKESVYSYFNHNYKLLLVVQCAFTGFYSSIAGAIYYPVLSIIEKEFHINEEQVNITVVVYFLFQGVAPSIMGGLADSLGRRPVVLSSIMLYFVACIGLARSNSYSQILGLRCLQAAGISPVIAVNSGIMGDITTKAERGGYVGYVSGFQVIGTALGALIGALLANRWGWRSIFWFLVIGSGVCLFCSFIILTETKRTIVGNGSVTPTSKVNYAPVLRVKPVRNMLHLDRPERESLEPRVKINFLAPLDVLKNARLNILLYIAGIQYATYTTHQTALSTVLSTKYNMKVLDIGLCYLPTGLCTMTTVVTAGRYLNWFYRRESKKHRAWLHDQIKQIAAERKITEEEAKEITDNDPKYIFNLIEVRLKAGFVTLVLSSIGYIAYGWCLDVKAPLPAVLVCSGFASLFSNCILTFSTTTMVDLFPSKGSTATGCLNLYRCSLSAIFIGCLSRMAKAMNYGGVFTLMGGVNILSSFLLFYLTRHGKEITFERRKEEAAFVEAANKLKEANALAQEKQHKCGAQFDEQAVTDGHASDPEHIV